MYFQFSYMNFFTGFPFKKGGGLLLGTGLLLRQTRYLRFGNSMKREETMKFEKINSFNKKKKNEHPPPPPRIFATPNYFFFNVGNSIKREENMKFWRKKILKILFFSIFKFIKNSNNIPSISKTIQHTPMTWCTYLQSFEKIQRCVFELQCEN